MNTPMENFIAVLAILVIVVMYLLPWLIALMRGSKYTVAVGLLNLLAGWTVVGWVAAFVWSWFGKEECQV